MSLLHAGIFTLGWRPFLDPLGMHATWWVLLIPLAFGVAVVYKAVRLPTLERYWRQVALMTTQIVLAMVALGAATFVFVEYMLPAFAPQ